VLRHLARQADAASAAVDTPRTADGAAAKHLATPSFEAAAAARIAELRADAVTEGGATTASALLAAAARSEQGYFTVPKVMDE
jgi:Asp-tRNA(Asn)/Glu-tRNA(Gln) amidotransferase C subunit